MRASSQPMQPVLRQAFSVGATSEVKNACLWMSPFQGKGWPAKSMRVLLC